VLCRVIIFLLAISFLPLQLPSRANEIVMRNGERFKTSAVWEEGDKIRFDLQGLVVSVDKTEVVAVIRNNDKVMEPAAIENRVPRQTSASGENEKPKTPPEVIKDSQPVHRSPQSNHPAPALQAGQGSLPSHRSSRHAIEMDLEGVFWGMSPGALSGLEKIRTEPVFGGIDQYWRPEQSLSLGKASLDGWVFGFWKDQLYAIVLWAEGPGGYDRMKNEVFFRYGEGTRSQSHDERYIWIAEDTQHMLEFDSELNTGLFFMRSSRMNARLKQLYP
jgi:hypothetical protein